MKDCAIYMLAADGSVNSWSSGAEQSFGYRQDEVVGRHQRIFFTEEDRGADEPNRELEEAAAKGRCESEGWRVRKDGSRFWANVLVTALRDDGHLRGFANVTRDLTERKAAVERLAYLAAFPEENPNPVVGASVDGRVMYANPSALRLFPDILEEGSRHPWLAGWDAIARSVRQGSAVGERDLTIGDRTFHQVLARLPGQDIRVYGIDISERQRAEHALRAKEAELELILDRTPFMLTRCSRELRYRYVSRAYAEMIGRTPPEIAGRPIVEIMGEEGLETIRPHVETVLRGEPAEYEEEVHFAGVGARRLHVIYVPDRDEHGWVIGWIANIVDVTEQMQAEALRVQTRGCSRPTGTGPSSSRCSPTSSGTRSRLSATASTPWNMPLPAASKRAGRRRSSGARSRT